MRLVVAGLTTLALVTSTSAQTECGSECSCSYGGQGQGAYVCVRSDNSSAVCCASGQTKGCGSIHDCLSAAGKKLCPDNAGGCIRVNTSASLHPDTVCCCSGIVYPTMQCYDDPIHCSFKDSC